MNQLRIAIANRTHEQGMLFYMQGRHSSALEYFTQTYQIYKNENLENKDFSAICKNIALCYRALYQRNPMPQYLEKALRFADESIKVATSGSYEEILGLAYHAKGDVLLDAVDYDAALSCYTKEKDISEKDVRTNPANYYKLILSYASIANVRLRQNDFHASLEDYKKAEEILNTRLESASYQDPNIATLYGNMGLLYMNLKDFNKSIDYHQKSIDILTRIAPNTHALAIQYSNMADLYFQIGNNENALDLYKKAYAINKNTLDERHPFLLRSAYHISLISLKRATIEDSVLQDSEIEKLLQQALDYAEITIAKDQNYKFAHNIKGQILERMDRSEDALGCYQEALRCDPGYGDAKINELQLRQKQLASLDDDIDLPNEQLERLQKDIEESANIQATDYDEIETQRLRRIDPFIQLPIQKYIVGSLEFQNTIQDLLQNLSLRIEKQEEKGREYEQRLDIHEQRLGIIDRRMHFFEEELISMNDSLNMVDNNLENINKQLRLEKQKPESTRDEGLLSDLHIERDKLNIRRQKIEGFTDYEEGVLYEYYSTFLAELERTYIASTLLSGEYIAGQQSEKYQTAASYATIVTSMFPVIGNIASQLIEGGAAIIDARNNMKKQYSIKNIQHLAGSISEFDEIAMRVAIAKTEENHEEIKGLKGKVVTRSWSEKLQETLLEHSVAENIARFLTDTHDNPISQISLLAKTHAVEVINYLQQGTNATRLANTSRTRNEGTIEYQRKESNVAERIINATKLDDTEEIKLEDQEGRRRKSNSSKISPAPSPRATTSTNVIVKEKVKPCEIM